MHVCARARACVWVQMLVWCACLVNMRAHVWGTEVNLEYHSSSAIPIDFGDRSLSSLDFANYATLVGQQAQASSCLYLPALGLHTQLLTHRFWGLNLWFHLP